MIERAPNREVAPLPPIEQKEWKGSFWRAVSAQAANERHPDENQDVILANEKLGLFILCDGMGGHDGGREAATTVAVAVEDYLEKLDWEVDDHEALELLPKSMIRALRSAQEALIRQRGEANMDTTATSVVLYRHSGGAVMAIIGHVGNCRAYSIQHNGEVKQLTEDDDLMATLDGAKLVLGDHEPEELDRRRKKTRREMEQAQTVHEMGEEARMLYNYRNHTMGVGSERMTVAVDVYRFPEGGRIALMSDGVYENLGRSTGGLLSMATARPSAVLAEQVVREAQQNGHIRPKHIPTAHPDDMSVVFIEVT
jgi:serine/threonine protein phosphatase PrpC